MKDDIKNITKKLSITKKLIIYTSGLLPLPGHRLQINQ